MTLLLSGIGLWHSRRVPAEEEIPNYQASTTTTHEAGRQPLIVRPIGQYGPCAPEPRSGKIPSRGTGAGVKTGHLE